KRRHALRIRMIWPLGTRRRKAISGPPMPGRRGINSTKLTILLLSDSYTPYASRSSASTTYLAPIMPAYGSIDDISVPGPAEHADPAHTRPRHIHARILRGLNPEFMEIRTAAYFGARAGATACYSSIWLTTLRA